MIMWFIYTVFDKNQKNYTYFHKTDIQYPSRGKMLIPKRLFLCLKFTGKNTHTRYPLEF